MSRSRDARYGRAKPSVIIVATRGAQRQQVAQRVDDDHALHAVDGLASCSSFRCSSASTASETCVDQKVSVAAASVTYEVDQRHHPGHHQQQISG